MEDYSDYPLHEFDIRREGRRWPSEEFRRKHPLYCSHPEVPERLEFLDGRIFLSDGQRLTMLGWMLKQLGVDAAVRLGNPEVWREVLEALEREQRG